MEYKKLSENSLARQSIKSLKTFYSASLPRTSLSLLHTDPKFGSNGQKYEICRALCILFPKATIYYITYLCMWQHEHSTRHWKCLHSVLPTPSSPLWVLIYEFCLYHSMTRHSELRSHWIEESLALGWERRVAEWSLGGRGGGKRCLGGRGGGNDAVEVGEMMLGS